MSLSQAVDFPLEQIPEELIPPTDLLSDEPPMETERHLRQMLVLIDSLENHWQDRQDFYVSGNMTVYYYLRQLRNRDFLGPDFFVVLNTERRERKSWMVWDEEGKYPNVIVEILSESTADVDRGQKKLHYQEIFRTPDYFWFDPFSQEFRGFHLVNSVYQEIAPNQQGWRWSEQLQLYLGAYRDQLRFWTPAGDLVLTSREWAEQEHQRAEQKHQRAEALAARLRELGIDP